MYKSKYANLIQHLMNEHDLILLDSEQQEIEKWVEKDLKAISVTRCSTQFFCCKDAIEQRCNEQCLGCYTYKRD